MYIKIKKIDGVEIGAMIKTITLDCEIIAGNQNNESIGGNQKFTSSATKVPQSTLKQIAEIIMNCQQQTEDISSEILTS